MDYQRISELIDGSPMNRGMVAAEWLANPLNLAIEQGSTVCIFEAQGEGIFEFHWLASDGGRKCINESREAIRAAFEQTNAHTFFGLISVDRKDSKIMAQWIGSAYVGDVDTIHGRCHLFIMTREILEGVKP